MEIFSQEAKGRIAHIAVLQYLMHHYLFQLVDIDECLSNTAFHLFLQTSLTTKVTMVFLMLVLIMVMIVLQTFLASSGSGLLIPTSQLLK